MCESEACCVDVGAGVRRLAKLFPHKLVVAMEIRDQVTSYVQQRIAALRVAAEKEGDSLAYQNAAAIRVNTMKQMANYFCKAQLEKMFFLFPDPHFKAANHRCAAPCLVQSTAALCLGGTGFTRDASPYGMALEMLQPQVRLPAWSKILQHCVHAVTVVLHSS